MGCDDGNLYAVNPNGLLKWTFTTDFSIISSPAIGKYGTIYIGGEDGNLYAVNPNGSRKWRYITGDAIDSSPAIGYDGTIYFGSDKIYALTPNGSKKWTYTTQDWVTSSPAIGSDGTLYIGSYDYNLYAIQTDTKPPRVITTNPTNLKTGTSRSAFIYLKFTENIKTGIYWSKISIKNLKTGKPVSITKSIIKNILYIKTSSKRSAFTWYQVTVPARSVKDYSGNNLAAMYTFKFRTGAL